MIGKVNLSRLSGIKKSDKKPIGIIIKLVNGIAKILASGLKIENLPKACSKKGIVKIWIIAEVIKIFFE